MILAAVLEVTVAGQQPLAARQAGELIVVSGSELTASYDCHGGTAAIDGRENILTFRNCTRVTISGNENQVTLADDAPAVDVLGSENTVVLTRVASIRVLGNENKVSWKAAAGGSGKKPKIANRGRRNQIRREAPARTKRRTG
jgi:Protein of unknown function (DUF3060)